MLVFLAAKGGFVDISTPTHRDHCDRHNQSDNRKSSIPAHVNHGDYHLRGRDSTIPFNVGSIGLQESVMYMHGAVFMLGIAFTLKEQGHVRVDVLYAKFPPRVKVFIDIVGHLLFLVPFPFSFFGQAWIMCHFPGH